LKTYSCVLSTWDKRGSGEGVKEEKKNKKRRKGRGTTVLRTFG